MTVHPDYPDPRLIPDDVPYEHICEVCGKTEMLTSAQAYDACWGYPPELGVWGIVSPRFCDRCEADATVWWALAMDGKTFDDITPEQRQTVARILNEMPDGMNPVTDNPAVRVPPAAERYFAANPDIFGVELTDDNTTGRRPR